MAPLTCQVLVDRLHLALRSDEGFLDHTVLLLFQVLHLSLQLPLSTRHLSFVDQDLERGGGQREQPGNKATSMSGGHVMAVTPTFQPSGTGNRQRLSHGFTSDQEAEPEAQEEGKGPPQTM